MNDLTLTSRQQLTLRAIMRMMGQSLDYITAPYSDAPTDTPQSRGLRRVDALRDTLLSWASSTPGVEPYKDGMTYGVIVGDTAFIPRKAGSTALKKIIDARLPFHRQERARCRQNKVAAGNLNLFGEEVVAEEAAKIGVRRFVHVVFVGDSTLLQVYAGVRTGRRIWDSHAVLFQASDGEREATAPLVAFDRQEAPGLQIVPVTSADEVPGGFSRFTDDKLEDISLEIRINDDTMEEPEQRG